MSYRNLTRLLKWYGASCLNLSMRPGPVTSSPLMTRINQDELLHRYGIVTQRQQGSFAPYSQSSSESPPNVVEDDNVISEINSKIESKNHGRLFAVIRIAGRQFKVTEQDVIVIRGYWAPDIGDRLRLEKVMLIGSSDFTLLGKPLLPRDFVRIEATVIEKTMSNTKLHFRHIPRGNYRRLYFYKCPYTMVRINLIEFDGLVDERKDIEGLRQTTLW